MQPEIVRNINVAIIVGGLDYELDDIERTEKDVRSALCALGCRSTTLCLRDPTFIESLAKIQADVCFIVDPFYVRISENGYLETADIREQLEKWGLPYTGSRPCTAALCRDKRLSKERFLEDGIQTPRDLQVPEAYTGT